MMGLPSMLLGVMAYAFAQAVEPALLFLPVMLGGLALLMGGLVLFVVINGMVNYWFTYVKTSPTWIEYRAGWRYGVRATWTDVERIGIFESLGFLRSDVLYLRQAEAIGPQITRRLRGWLGLKTTLFVALSGMSGWPTGGLADDLKYYAPQLFGEAPAPLVSDKA